MGPHRPPRARRSRPRSALAVTKGTVLFRHVLRNAALPIVTTLGMAFGYAITGSFVVEVVFNIPGMARVAVDAILQRDYVVIQTVVLIYVVLFIACAYLPYRLIWWVPTFKGLYGQAASMTVRFGLAYFLAVTGWLVLASTLGQRRVRRQASS